MHEIWRFRRAMGYVLADEDAPTRMLLVLAGVKSVVFRAGFDLSNGQTRTSMLTLAVIECQ